VTTFEFAVVDGRMNRADIEIALNKLGSEGYQLVSFLPTFNLLVMSRAKPRAMMEWDRS
jgi:hypothetical protein